MTLVDDLLAGPRGRHFLMEVALASERDHGPLFQSTWRVGSLMKRNTRKFRIPRKQSAQARARTVAPLLERVPLVELTPRLLYEALERTVFAATYWELPSDGDVFLSAKPLRPGLRRIASHVVTFEVTSGWSDGFQPDRHAAVSWKQPELGDPVHSVAENLGTRREAVQMESTWWSTPPWPIITTTRELVDGTPGALRFIEDGLGWTTGWVRAATVSADARVFTISGPGTWADLCWRFPLDVTGSKGVDWRLTTGYPHDWVMPDFAQVAQHYDALHLSMRGYFATAGRVIPVDERRAGLLAGWDPGQTFWLTDAVELSGTPVVWRDCGDGDGAGKHDWRRENG